MNNQSNITWGPIRAVLRENFYFADIKDIAGLAGIDVVQLSDLQQRPGGNVTKDMLLASIESQYEKMSEEDKHRFVTIVTEEVLRRSPRLESQLRDYLSRLGWTVHDGKIIPLEIFDTSELEELPPEAEADLMNAVVRLRDGNLSGAITSACAAIDSVTSAIYLENSLGDPGQASFQERVSRSFEARAVLPALTRELRELNWSDGDIQLFVHNLHGSLNQAAHVMQKLRPNMGDVHGTKPVIEALAYNSIKWATLILRLLKREQS